MKVVIFAGGKGTRLSEETGLIPKPMLQIGEKPILHHIMDIYMKYGHNDFIIATGYKKESILGYFMGLETLQQELHWANAGESGHCWQFQHRDFSVTVVDTGLESQTGGRLKRLEPYLKDDFMLTYGDGISDVSLEMLSGFHYRSARTSLATVTAVPPVPRFGEMELQDDLVVEFGEKPIKSKLDSSGWINGGFFIVSPKVLQLIQEDSTNFEKEVLPILSEKRELDAFRWTYFWHCIDTMRDLEYIREEYKERGAFWLK